MAARSKRCSRCSTHWPNQPIYGRCPECDQRTWESQGDPIGEDEARSRKLHVEFEKFCERREQEQVAGLERMYALGQEPIYGD